MGKASRKKRRRAEAEAPEPTAPMTPPPPPGPLPFARLVPWLAAAGLALGVVAAYGPAGELEHGGLLRLGLLLGLLTAGLATAHAWRTRAGGAPRWLAPATLVAGTLSLMALMGRHPEVHLSPFAAAHTHFTGVPVELAFVAMAIGALAIRAELLSRGAWWCFALGGLGCLAALGMPHHWLGDVSLPIGRALAAIAEGGDERLAGPTVLALLVPVGAWCYGVALALSRRTAGVSWTTWPPRVCWVAGSGGWLLALYHALAPLWSNNAVPAQLGVGLAISSSLVLLMGSGAAAVRELAKGDSAPRVVNWLDLIAPLTLLGLYGALKIHGMGHSNTDENIYFYMADALSRGEWPYLDYFFAHPPLHVLVPGAVMAVTGFSFTLAKSFSVVAGAITGVSVWAIGREHLGRPAALVAMVAFLFACETLKATTNMTGVNLTTMWLTLGVWQGLRGRGWTAGFLFGLAACTGFYAMGAICAALALGLFHSRGFALRQLAGFVLVAGAINAAFFAVAGDAYLDGVYRYHGLKAVREAGMVPLLGGDLNPLSALLQNLGVMVEAKPFTRDLYYHSHLWIAGLVAPIIGAAAWLTSPRADANPLRFFDPRRLWRDGEHGVIAMVWLIALALFVQYAMFRELYSFYFVLIYPTLALCLGWSLWHGASMVAGAVGPGLEIGRRGRRAALGTLGVALLCLWPAVSSHANKAFPSEQKGVGTRHDYTWRPAPLAEPLSGVAEALFWEDHRLRGNLERGYRHYLWTKKRRFSVADDIAAWIAANSAPDETIAGASGAAPLIALLADRRLAGGESDTNSKRFKVARRLAQQGEAPERDAARPHDTTRLVDDATYWEAICADNVRYLVSTSRSYFVDKKLGRLPTAQRWFKKVKVFWDEELKYGRRYPVTLYERTGEPLPDGRVCRWE